MRACVCVSTAKALVVWGLLWCLKHCISSSSDAVFTSYSSPFNSNVHS